MANFGPEPIMWTFVAGADLSTKQFTFVKISANGTVVPCAAVTDKPIGVLQTNPVLNGSAEVLVTGITKVVANAALSAGAAIGTDAAGLAGAYVPGTDTTKYLVGTVIDGNTMANGLVTAAINCAAPARGA